ncbi:MAG TPA: hypothetical protein VGQ73_01430, partial [Gemmatimonadales bacterium]|nr:hypothetical protein [Gemmatimonadales bacterium]
MIVLAGLPGQAPAQQAPAPRARPPVASRSAQVTRLLRTLPPRQRIAQLIMPWIAGSYAAFDDTTLAKVRGWIDSLRI